MVDPLEIPARPEQTYTLTPSEGVDVIARRFQTFRTVAEEVAEATDDADVRRLFADTLATIESVCLPRLEKAKDALDSWQVVETYDLEVTALSSAVTRAYLPRNLDLPADLAYRYVVARGNLSDAIADLQHVISWRFWSLIQS